MSHKRRFFVLLVLSARLNAAHVSGAFFIPFDTAQNCFGGSVGSSEHFDSVMLRGHSIEFIS
jgi:hypothetical protein